MKSRFLFPHQSRILGYACILAYIPVMVFKKLLHHGYSNQDSAQKLADASGLFNSEHILTAIAMLFLFGGLLLVAFSKEKVEDEQILQLRLDSLHWAIYLNYLILIIGVFVTPTFQFIGILLFNLWAPLLFFIIRFRWKIYLLNRLFKNEEELV